MVQFTLLTAILALTELAYTQCGSGTPDATVTGSGSSFVATKGTKNVYTGSDYAAAIQAAIKSIASGQRVSVMASGSIGTTTIDIDSGKTFEGCGTINAVMKANKGAIRSMASTGVSIPYLTMTGNPTFGLLFYGTTDLTLGDITMNLEAGMGIRFHRDEAANKNVKMGTIKVTGASSHAVETWNIDGLEIDSVVAKDCGESGLLLQTVTNAKIGTVDGDNVGEGTGYGTLRFANNAGQIGSSYDTNIVVNKVTSRGGGRGVFCVSQSGGAEILEIDLADNGNNAILIENCYNFSIRGGTVSGGGEVRVSARTEFPNTKLISVTAKIDGTTVRESPCADGMTWDITGNAVKTIC